MRQTPCDGKHDSSHGECRQDGSDEGEGEDGADVTEEEPFLHAVPGVEDDGRDEEAVDQVVVNIEHVIAA